MNDNGRCGQKRQIDVSPKTASKHSRGAAGRTVEFDLDQVPIEKAPTVIGRPPVLSWLKVLPHKSRVNGNRTLAGPAPRVRIPQNKNAGDVHPVRQVE